MKSGLFRRQAKPLELASNRDKDSNENEGGQLNDLQNLGGNGSSFNLSLKPDEVLGIDVRNRIDIYRIIIEKISKSSFSIINIYLFVQ